MITHFQTCIYVRQKSSDTNAQDVIYSIQKIVFFLDLDERNSKSEVQKVRFAAECAGQAEDGILSQVGQLHASLEPILTQNGMLLRGRGKRAR